MHFPSLKVLKDSRFESEEIKQFDTALFSVYVNQFSRRFHPRIYSYFDLELNEKKWIQALDRLSLAGLLNKQFELCSPFSGETLEVYESANDIPFDTTRYSLGREEEEFEITEQDVLITYQFTSRLTPVKDLSESKFSQSQSLQLSLPNGNGAVGVRSLHSSSQLDLLTQMKLYPEVILEEEIARNQTVLQQILATVAKANNSQEKGESLEILMEKLLASPYLRLMKRGLDYSTGEIDVVFKVRKIEGTIFQNFSDLLIVECKNRVKKMDAKEVRAFVDKMNDMDCNVGVIASREGITPPGMGVVSSKWKESRKSVIVLDQRDLTSIVSGQENLYTVLEDKFYGVRIL